MTFSLQHLAYQLTYRATHGPKVSLEFTCYRCLVPSRPQTKMNIAAEINPRSKLPRTSRSTDSFR